MATLFEVEKNFCIYCKQPLTSGKSTNYHIECLRLVNKYNNRRFVKIKKWYANHKFIKKNLKWTRKILDRIIYSVGGINIFLIILYEIFTNIK